MSDAAPQGLSGRLSARWPQAALALGIVVLDQLSKQVVLRAIAPLDTVTVIPGFFELTHVVNTGGVWGLGRDLPHPLRLFVFLALPSLITLFAIWYSLTLPVRDRLRQTPIALVVGGAIGNLIDRLAHSHVIDFLSFHWRQHYWPSFNLADSAICTGIGLLMLSIVLEKDGDEAGEEGERGALAG